MVRYCIGTLDSFSKKNIKIDKERKSKDGLQAIKHIELLSDAEFNAVRFDKSFDFQSDDNIKALMETSAWKADDL